MSKKDPYKDSAYDASGMPLGTTTADYDNADEVRMAQVKSTYEPVPTVFDMDYQPKQFTKKETGMDRDKGLPYGVKGFNSSISDEVGLPEPVKAVDMEDPAEKRKLIVEVANDKGFKEVPELPKVEKKETVEDIEKLLEDEKK